MEVFVTNRMLQRYGNEGMPDSVLDYWVREAREESGLTDASPTITWTRHYAPGLTDGYMLNIEFNGNGGVEPTPQLKCGLCGRNQQVPKLRPAACVCCDVHEGQCKHRIGGTI